MSALNWTDWSWQPTVVVALATLVLMYAAAWRCHWLDRSDDVAPWLPGARWRMGMFGLGIAISGLALLSPIDRGGDDYLLSIHMVQHLLLMMVAPPLLLLGVVGGRRIGPGTEPSLGSRWARAWRRLTQPWTALLIFNAVLLLWHLPSLYDTTLTVEPIHILEHLTFGVVGVVFWWPVVDPSRGGATAVSPMEKVAMLVTGGVPPTILGLIMALAPRPFYDFYTRVPRLWGLSPIVDQQIAGVVMFGVGNLIYFAAISVIFLRIAGDPADDEREMERSASASIT